MKRRIGGLLAALVLATIGTVALVGYVQSAKDKAVAGEKLVDVLVVSKPIAKGTPVGAIEGMVKTVQVPAKVQAEGSVTTLASLKSLVAGVNLVPGEQLVSSRFVTAQVAAQQVDVPPGALQVTISLEPQRAVGGQVRVGDTVGVVASFSQREGNTAETHLILHKVLVTSVQVEQKPPSDNAKKSVDDRTPTLAPTGNLMVTLALDAASVERVVFAAEHGKVWLTAEPNDANEAGTRVVNAGSLF